MCWRGYDGFHRIELVMDRWGWACEMIDLINLQKQRFDHIMANELKPRVAKMMHHILFPPSEEVVNNNDAVTSCNQFVYKMASHEACPSCHYHSQCCPFQTKRNFGTRSTDDSHVLLLLPEQLRPVVNPQGVAKKLPWSRVFVIVDIAPFWQGSSAMLARVYYCGAKAVLGLLKEEQGRCKCHTYENEQEPLLLKEILHWSRPLPLLPSLWRLRQGVPRKLMPPMTQAQARHCCFSAFSSRKQRALGQSIRRTHHESKQSPPASDTGAANSFLRLVHSQI